MRPFKHALQANLRVWTESYPADKCDKCAMHLAHCRCRDACSKCGQEKWRRAWRLYCIYPQATVANTPRRWLSAHLLAAGWTQVDNAQGHKEFVTDYPKALGAVLSLEKMTGVYGYGYARNCTSRRRSHMPSNAKVLLAAVPPGRALHRTRERMARRCWRWSFTWG